MDIENDDLYIEAYDKWGEVAQIDMLQEECAELIFSISKYKRGKPDSLDAIAEEMADVEIMIGQVKCGLNLRNKTREHYERKIERLKKRISKDDNK